MSHRNITESEVSLLAIHGCFPVDLRGEVAVHHGPLVVRSCAVCDQGLGTACKSFKTLGCRDAGAILGLFLFVVQFIIARELGSGCFPCAFITFSVYRSGYLMRQAFRNTRFVPLDHVQNE